MIRDSLIIYLTVNGVEALPTEEVLRIQRAPGVTREVLGLAVKSSHHPIHSIAKPRELESLIHVASSVQQLLLTGNFQVIALVLTDGT
jgi:hypothetical protein